MQAILAAGTFAASTNAFFFHARVLDVDVSSELKRCLDCLLQLGCGAPQHLDVDRSMFIAQWQE